MPDNTRKGDEIGLMWRVSPDMMCVLDAAGRFTAVNPAWESTLGWSEGDMVGQSYRSFLHPDDIAKSAEAFETLVGGNPVLRFENRYRSKDGAYNWFSWNAVPDHALFFCTVRDVTDAKENEDIIAGHDREVRLREEFLAVLEKTFRDILGASEVPAANETQCGWGSNHTLSGAQGAVSDFLDQRDAWGEVYA